MITILPCTAKTVDLTITTQIIATIWDPTVKYGARDARCSVTLRKIAGARIGLSEG